MKNDNYNNIFENMGRVVLKVAKGIAKIVEEISAAASSEALRAFAEFLNNLPDDIKDTQLIILKRLGNGRLRIVVYKTKISL